MIYPKTQLKYNIAQNHVLIIKAPILSFGMVRLM